MDFNKIVIWLVCITLGIGVTVAREWPDSRPVLTMCDVGQGDAVLVTQGFNQVLIDGGPEASKALHCLSQHMPFWDRNINIIVVTHPETDHVGGLPEVLQRYRVKTILTTPFTTTTDTAKTLETGIKGTTARRLEAMAGMQMQVGSLYLEVLSPPGVTTDQPTSVNEQSIVILLRAGESDVLLTGDISESTEKVLLRTRTIPDVDVLKVAHHGAGTSTSKAWLEATRPETAFISVGKNNRYGHPDGEVLLRLKNQGIIIHRTDIEGTVARPL